MDTTWEAPYDPALSSPFPSNSLQTTADLSDTMPAARTPLRHSKGPTKGASTSMHAAYDDDDDDYDEIGTSQLSGAPLPTQGDE